MRQPLRWTILSAALAACLFVCGRPATAGPITLSIVAKPGDVIGGKTLGGGLGNGLFGLSLNNNGEITFVDGFDGGVDANAIFTQNSVLVSTGDVIGGKTLDFIAGDPSLNNNGGVAFEAHFVGNVGNSVSTQNSVVASTGDTIGGKTITSILGVALNDNSDIAFAGQVAGPTGDDAIFKNNSVLVSTGDVIGGKTLAFIGDPSLNNNADIAFRDFILGGGGAIFTQNSLVAAPGDVIGGKTLTGFGLGTPSLNNNGDIAFGAGIQGGGSAIFTQNSLVAASGDVIGGKTLTFVHDPFLNDNGDVAFIGDFTDGTEDAVILATSTPPASSPANGNFQNSLNGWTVTGPGTAMAVESPAGSGNFVAQLTTGSPVTLSQLVDTPISPFLLDYDFRFLTDTGMLDVLLDGMVIDSLSAADFGPMAAFNSRTVFIDDPTKLGLTDVELAFRFDGPTGSVVQLDNVSVSAVPEPSSFVLLSLGAIGLWGYNWRRKKKDLPLVG